MLIAWAHAQVFKAKAEVENQQGWPGEAKIKEMLTKHGAKLATSAS